MDLRFDHVVIVVMDLALAVDDYSALGFSVVPGGEHADGLTHNALIAFRDDSYIELVAFKSTPPADHPFGRAISWGGGFVTFALLPTDIRKSISEARANGLELAGPTRGSRIRPDGEQIAWQTARADTTDVPFLCADVTPRERRVPGDSARNHPNGVTGIESLTVLVSDVGVSTRRYRALLGIEPLVAPGEPSLTFQLHDTSLVLAEPVDEQMEAYVAERGDVPYALVLRAHHGAPSGWLNPVQTHSARIEIVND